MPRKVSDNKDIERGKRFMEERKKIWKSREDFSKETQLSAGTLQNWEGKGSEIPSAALNAIADHGGDVMYILTGQRAAQGSTQNQGKIDGDDLFLLGAIATLQASLSEMTRQFFAQEIDGEELARRILQGVKDFAQRVA